MQPLMARRILEWQKGERVGPWELGVCPTYHCNLKCGICSRSWEGTTHPALLHELPDERWLSLIDEAAEAGVRYLSIGGGGEPTMRIDLVMAMCIKAKEYGIGGHLQTNGTRLREQDIQKLIDIKWDHITISLDGPNAEINDTIRYRNAFEETVKRIAMLNTQKTQSHAVLPELVINTVLTAQNFDKLEEMADFCINNRVQYFSVVPLLEYSPDMKEYILTQEQQSALPRYVNRAIQKADAAGLAHNLEGLLFIRKTNEKKQQDTFPEGHIGRVRCLEPWRGIWVSSSGNIAPCCYFWDGDADTINETTLQEVWHGPYLTAFRKDMLAGKLPEPCRKCGFPDTLKHKLLVECLQSAVTDDLPLTAAAFLKKVLKNIRERGLRKSIKRFQQWRLIRKSLQNEGYNK